MTTGEVEVWLMNGTSFLSSSILAQVSNVAGGWNIVGSGDFNGDGYVDILLQNINTGHVAVWLMGGNNYLSDTILSIVGNVAGGWHVVGVGDYNADSKLDILLENINTGQVAVWFMNGTTFMADTILSIVGNITGGWHIVGPR
jgi:hypothetical protein